MTDDGDKILRALRGLVQEKNLSEEEVHKLVRHGLQAGLNKEFGGEVDAEIIIDEEGVDMVVLKEVVEDVEDPLREVSLQEAQWEDETFEVGDLMEIPVEFEEFGRYAVRAVKQRITQGLIEGERQQLQEQFADRIGELIHGEVQRVERGKVVVLPDEAPQTEAFIPRREQNDREKFRQGEPIRATLVKIEETSRGPRLILSRANADFVARLFELEVPEIYEGSVTIKAVAREAGGRTKLAVASHDESVDPVGACVGMRGARVQAVVSELGGERIDIIPWNPDPEIFTERALAPADVRKVIADPERHTITVIVNEDQLSQAIGSKGQNVRLASDLVGWQIDLYSAEEWLEKQEEGEALEMDEEYEVSDFPLSELPDIPPATLAALEAVGVQTFFDVLDMGTEDFLDVPGIDQEQAQQLNNLIDDLTIVEDEEIEDLEEEEIETLSAHE